jgi:hypothetical protein
LVGNNGTTLTTKEQTGEDWFYDFCASMDLETNKPDGFICVGYQRNQCNNGNNPQTPNCAIAVYEELRDNIKNVNSTDNDASIWFLDLCGDAKWHYELPKADN